MAFDSWPGCKTLTPSTLSVDSGEVFLLFGDFDPVVEPFFEFGEFNLRHCAALPCVLVLHLALACFFGDSLNSLLFSDASLKWK